MTSLDTDIIPRETLAFMVEAYQKACSEIDQAYALFDQANARMINAYGTAIDYDVHSFQNPKAEDAKLKIRQKAWRVIINRLELKKVMSIDDLKKIERSFEDMNKIPEIDLPTVMDITIGMLNNHGEYAKKLVEEVYAILMPGTNKGNEYKTNKKYARRALGKKVILTSMISIQYGGKYSVGYGWASDEITAIDRVFHALDGKNIQQKNSYLSPLVDAINTVDMDGAGETEYFKFHCYRNGNLHLEFKRLDLVSKLNQIAGVKNAIPD